MSRTDRHSFAERTTPKTSIIVDTDPGIDDAMALLYLSLEPSVQLHSITTVFGNGGCDLTTRNAMFLVERFGLSVPVHAGADGPLEGSRIVPHLKVHGEDGLGNTGVSLAQAWCRSDTPAWQHIADSVMARPGEISLLAIGPLTNLALALRHRPEVVQAVREVVVMGGAFGTNGRQGNITPLAEANFYYDPLAADLVLGADWPVTVVGLDVTSDVILSSEQARSLPERAGAVGDFLWRISRDYEAIYRKFDGIDGFAIHDVAAAVRLVEPALFETRRAALTVDAHESRGQSHVSTAPGRPQQSYCVHVSAATLVDRFLQTLARLERPGREPSRSADEGLRR